MCVSALSHVPVPAHGTSRTNRADPGAAAAPRSAPRFDSAEDGARPPVVEFAGDGVAEPPQPARPTTANIATQPQVRVMNGRTNSSMIPRSSIEQDRHRVRGQYEE